METILVTGGAGFIGSNFIKYILSKYNYKIINLDLLTYAGNLDNLTGMDTCENYSFVKGNIADVGLVNEIFNNESIKYVINLAAESHVDNSISNPTKFMETNIIGTQVLLDAAKTHWFKGYDETGNPVYKEGVKFLQISTDEVYGSLGREGKFSEDSRLLPNSPYSSSKAGADLIVRAYNKTYSLPVNITRCSNNYGPMQFKEKLIPLMIERCMNEEPLPVYGDGEQIREWIHVEDHCRAIDLVLHNGKNGEVYNVGSNTELRNIDLVKKLIQITGKKNAKIEYVEDRLGHDRRYAVDYTKISTELGWKPECDFDYEIINVVNWYMNLYV